MGNKISIIGAGSAVFSLGLVRNICLTPNLAGSTVSLMDINQERLETIYALCKRYAQEIGIELTLQKTMDRRESLQDADFVINTALAAGHHRLREGWAIAQKHGYRFGGSHHIMHDEPFWVNFYQFKLFDSVVSDMLEICPDAWHILVANPLLAGVTHLTRKYKRAKLVGLCTGSLAPYDIAAVLGLEKEYITFQAPGLNHFVWLTHFYYKGQDVFPILDDWIEKEAPKVWATGRSDGGLGPKAVDLYKRFGVFPIGDTCHAGGGAWPWWYHSDPETEKRWKEDPQRFWDAYYFPSLEKELQQVNRLSKDLSMKIMDALPSQESDVVTLVESIACDIPRVLVTNIQNTGDFVPGVPRDFEVEIPTLVSKRGIQGIKTDGLPGPLTAYMLRDRVAPVEIELEAYNKGSRELLHQLILMDPWSRSEEQAKNFLEDILALPYHEDMRQHYN
jgi:alpha-galactosidase